MVKCWVVTRKYCFQAKIRHEIARYAYESVILLNKTKKLPQLPKGIVFPKVITGIEALGRTTDRNKLIQFLQTLAGTLGGESIAQYVNVTEAIKRLATADGIETKGLIRTEEDLQAEAQAQQEQMQQQAQQQSLLNAGEKIAGNIPPKTLGESILNNQ